MPRPEPGSEHGKKPVGRERLTVPRSWDWAQGRKRDRWRCWREEGPPEHEVTESPPARRECRKE